MAHTKKRKAVSELANHNRKYNATVANSLTAYVLLLIGAFRKTLFTL